MTRRRLVLAFAVITGALVPLGALGAANDWWFLGLGGASVPATASQVVTEGEWDGKRWQLIAYPSTADGLCTSITFTDSRAHRARGASSCGPFVGVARTRTETAPEATIGVLAGDVSEELPAYVAGPVIEEAAMVEVRFGKGDVLRVPTVAGPERLRHVRFYAAQLPIELTPETWPGFLRSIAGLDASGNVVACLAPETAEDGTSPLSDCR